ncbi:MAG: NAD(P) transhydrogenase subunit alpha [Acidimicrobiaceae bacterium]|nr:NAD(P) transhydrogenase subunit alpha [Acidimicrobiaceae bacterium]
MRLRLLRETAPRENRVALVPDGVDVLVQRGCDVVVERAAGLSSGFGDDAYRSAGATIVEQFSPSADVADVVVSVRDAPQGSSSLNPAAVPATVFVGVFDPLWAPDRAQRHAGNGVSAFSLDLVPRVTRAQPMDVLSSMATIAGYEAVLLAAGNLPQMFPLMMTAAGTLAPARVLVLGAGVAGLQAIGTARRLGGVVEAYDVRPEAVEQIRSIGARALDLEASSTAVGSSAVTSVNGYAVAQSDDAARLQREMLAPHVAGADVVVTAASVPGRPSPLLVTAEMVDGMDSGSVLVDLAAERGGNCEVTEADETVERNGVTVLGPTDLVSKCARHASQMFSRNLVAFLEHLAPEGVVEMRSDDEILSAMLVTHDGAVVHPGVAAALEEA